MCRSRYSAVAHPKLPHVPRIASDDDAEGGNPAMHCESHARLHDTFAVPHPISVALVCRLRRSHHQPHQTLFYIISILANPRTDIDSPGVVEDESNDDDEPVALSPGIVHNQILHGLAFMTPFILDNHLDRVPSVFVSLYRTCPLLRPTVSAKTAHLLHIHLDLARVQIYEVLVAVPPSAQDIGTRYSD
ncbi:hypothetical protein BLNAU_5844 [Blattamonas nauphoetae]|uniref:Uncharacterized protein n=1 Tax=Blattamonas nauphoetae TaxID=2049346 RepID=A0ABQ9Y6D2_9EUKA|nr:hypothetical protein BLNAU_5844 [Blattamonas nauphoetae]